MVSICAFTNVRISKLFKLNDDVVPGDFEMEMRSYYKRLAGHQYTQHLMRIPKGPLYVLMDKWYPMVMDRLKDHSNWPQLKPGEIICPLKKGVYWVKDFTAASSDAPLFIIDGFWKLEFDFDYKQFTCRFYIRTTNKFV